jgi:hypothetical protein
MMRSFSHFLRYLLSFLHNSLLLICMCLVASRNGCREDNTNFILRVLRPPFNPWLMFLFVFCVMLSHNEAFLDKYPSIRKLLLRELLSVPVSEREDKIKRALLRSGLDG